MSEAIPKHALDRLLGTDHWCDRDGKCEVHRVGSTGPSERWACHTCLVLWAVQMTALGPAWWKVGTISPSTETAQ